jgi:cupin fold WbuC family metalloprotein
MLGEQRKKPSSGGSVNDPERRTNAHRTVNGKISVHNGGLANGMTSVQLITEELVEAVAQKAAESTRLRMNHNFHASATDNPHRFLNVMLRDTYVRPHRHLQPPKAETFLVLEGAAVIVLFDDFGNINARHELGTVTESGRVWGVDIGPGLWHTLFPLTDRAVCFEVKPGPWDPVTDKDFAPWAPREDDPAKETYLKKLKQQIGIS